MLVLPSPRRAHLVAFWVVICVFGGLVIGSLLAILVAPRWIGLGIVASVACAGVGIRRLVVVERAYKAWNLLARWYTRLARGYLLRISYYMIFAVVGAAGSNLMVNRQAGQSMWVARETSAAVAYSSQYDGLMRPTGKKGWIRETIRWSVQSGNAWACFALPFILLISALDPGEERLFPAGIYTLF